jgi:hypothetical protein
MSPNRRKITTFLDAIGAAEDYLLVGRETRKTVAVIEAIYVSTRAG